ncbi:hypothetical protein [Nocardia sp. IFM 10818]
MSTQIIDAAKEFAEVFDNWEAAAHVGSSFQCSEVEALAELLRACGRDDAAESWIDWHAEDDECGDAHCRCAGDHCENEDEDGE